MSLVCTTPFQVHENGRVMSSESLVCGKLLVNPNRKRALTTKDTKYHEGFRKTVFPSSSFHYFSLICFFSLIHLHA
jgi:hypothetical protein